MRKLILAVVLCSACTDAGNTAIEIPFALFASDELSSSSTGVCTVTPQTQAGGLYKGSGMLEVNPELNPFAQYNLEVQVENYLSQEVLTDSQGNTVVGANENDFHMEKATIKYIDIENNLGLSGPYLDNTALISGVVRTGGTQGATAVGIQAVPNSEASYWSQAFLASIPTGGALAPGVPEDVVLEVQVFGVLGSGEQATSGLFHFPLQVCFNCGNLPLNPQDGGPNGIYYPPTGSCGSGSTPIALGHGPCCSPQDFSVSCIPCGSPNDPCCGGPSGGCGTNPVAGTCTGMPPSGVEICNTVPQELTEAATCPMST
jgi:hypothetical protein